jgi:hypothetical protein
MVFFIDQNHIEWPDDSSSGLFFMAANKALIEFAIAIMGTNETYLGKPSFL